MKSLFFLTFSFLFLSEIPAQTIKRWSGGKKEISSRQIAVKPRQNIFNDFGWSKPDIKSMEIDLKNDYKFSFKGNFVTLSKLPNDQMNLTYGNDSSLKAKKKTSKGDIYHNRNALQLKVIQRQRWVSYQVNELQRRPVTKYRTVATYEYNGSLSTKTVYKTESYTDWESHYVPVTKWKWEYYNDYVLVIPNYEYYSFLLADSSQLFVYEVSNNGENNYYLQNVSYLSAVDEEGINHILIDGNVNGVYTDIQDQLFFNSWNPYSEKSSYRKVSFFRENNWYTLNYLKDEYFISTHVENGVLSLNYKNDEYTDSEERGSVSFTNFPTDASVEINGKRYSIKSSKKAYKSEYGFFKIKVSRPGYLDFEKTYTVDKNNLNQTIDYELTSQAATLEIKNIYVDDYFIVVTGENYYKTYYNKNNINIPAGENKIEIYTNGSAFTYSLNAEVGKSIDFDFEAEIQKKKE
jgi:hypothetical protein